MNNAHHFGIGTFINNVHTHDAETLARDILRNARASEATHTSKTASYAPKCTPGTRLKITSDMVEWVVSGGRGERRRSILWFSGPAGGGKTCIMRQVVVRCEEAGCLVASYFFSARVPVLQNEDPFVATLTHQFTTHPVLRPLILDAILQNPMIFDESLDLQMQKLIVEPLQSDTFRSHPISKKRLVVAIDGFDECRNHIERQHLLQLIHTLVTRLPKSILVILASRPELDIRIAFGNRAFKVLTRILRLQDYDGKEDTRIFFCDEFERIRQNHPMKISIPESWPIEAILQFLLDRSSGHFIFPATLMKHVDNPRRNPVELLEEVLALFSKRSSPPAADHPLAELDALYSLILHPPKRDEELMKRILHCLLGIGTTMNEEERHRSPFFIDQFLYLPLGTTEVTLCDLHSVLNVPSHDSDPKDQQIRFHHKTLQDYLVSPDRSGHLFQAPYQTHIDLTVLSCRHLEAWVNAPGGTNTEAAFYAANYWSANLRFCFEDKPRSVRLPFIILEFDPRIIWRYMFVRDFQEFAVPKLARDAIHQCMCEGSCVRLCMLLTRMERCRDRVERFSKSFASVNRRQRIAALHHFDFETGLYDDNDPPPSPWSRTPAAADSQATLAPSTLAPTLHLNANSNSMWRRFLGGPRKWFGGSSRPPGKEH